MSNSLRGLYYGQFEEPTWVEFDNTLEAKQELVEGLIEFVSLSAFGGPNAELIINEEGKFMFPGNRAIGEFKDIVAGPFVVVGPCNQEGNSTSLSQETAEEVKDFLKYRVISL